jgi:hypothetical protein
VGSSPIPLRLLCRAASALRAVRAELGQEGDSWEVLAASQRRLMLEIREQYGEEAWAMACEDPYLDHRPV